LKEMGNFSLDMAGYRIRFESDSGNLKLVPDSRFRNFSWPGSGYDILISVHNCKFSMPESAVKVFDAPYVEEINGIALKKSNKFWSIYKLQNDIYIKTSFPLSPGKKQAVLRLSVREMSWDLWVEKAGEEINPLEYPLDGLVLYYLSVINGDILIHASGVNNSGRGYLFSGVSGKGKTTLAKLWSDTGAQVIHDDRLILHSEGGSYRMLSTPVYQDDEPRVSPVDKIFLLEHGNKNELIPVCGAAAISSVMSNCIQHNWDQEIVARLIGSISFLCRAVQVYKLTFRPDRSVIDEILNNE